jgi:hypothetical protein
LGGGGGGVIVYVGVGAGVSVAGKEDCVAVSRGRVGEMAGTLVAGTARVEVEEAGTIALIPPSTMESAKPPKTMAMHTRPNNNPDPTCRSDCILVFPAAIDRLPERQ